MHFLRNEEAVTWCKTAPRSLTIHAETSILSYGGQVTRSAKYVVPPGYQEIIQLLHRILTVSTDDGFEGGLAWMLNWWGEKESEKVALKIIDQMRRGYSENRPLEDVPSCLFERNEVYDAIAFLVQPLLNTWAAQFVSASGKYTMTATVSGYLYLIARDQSDFDRVLQSTAGWKPWLEIPRFFLKRNNPSA